MIDFPLLELCGTVGYFGLWFSAYLVAMGGAIWTLNYIQMVLVFLNYIKVIHFYLSVC
jgi:hypothetical protein